MEYLINKENYRIFETIEINKLPGRSYFIPYPDQKSAMSVEPKQKRYASPKVICLNGDWDFRFYPKPSELPDVLDTGETYFDTIDVPSCWQFRGYDRPFMSISATSSLTSRLSYRVRRRSARSSRGSEWIREAYPCAGKIQARSTIS